MEIRSTSSATLPASTSLDGTIQLPPTAGTQLRFRYSRAFSALIPPVGRKSTWRNALNRALMALGPPAVEAGKNFTAVILSFSALISSDAVAMPGKQGMPTSWHRTTTSSSKPGDTMKLAPVSTASSTCLGVRTVPAPTRMSPRCERLEIAAEAASVLKVTSATGSPPRTRFRLAHRLDRRR